MIDFLKKFKWNIRLLNDSDKFMRYLYHRYFHSDKRFVKKYYKKNTGKELNLDNPVEFGEKIQWLKLYWHNSNAIKAADKYEVRKIVQKKIGSEILNDLYATYESPNEIELDKLPKSFVMKATHSSGDNFICYDKNKVNWDLQFKEFNKWLSTNFFWSTREWVYKNIKPRIICERLLIEDEALSSLTDYKFYCFDGEPIYCQVIRDRGATATIDFFDKKWNNMGFTGLNNFPNSKDEIKKPEKYEQMLEFASILAEGYPFVRVDFYYVNGRIIFGELTFFPKSGYGSFNPPEWNKKMGDLLKLPCKNE